MTAPKARLGKKQTRQYPNGVVLERRSQYTGTIVLLVNLRQYVASKNGPPRLRAEALRYVRLAGGSWALVCPVHDRLIPFTALKYARDEMSRPDGWCPGCAAPIGKRL